LRFQCALLLLQLHFKDGETLSTVWSRRCFMVYWAAGGGTQAWAESNRGGSKGTHRSLLDRLPKDCYIFNNRWMLHWAGLLGDKWWLRWNRCWSRSRPYRAGQAASVSPAHYATRPVRPNLEVSPWRCWFEDLHQEKWIWCFATALRCVLLESVAALEYIVNGTHPWQELPTVAGFAQIGLFIVTSRASRLG
jgi:hypothetical protein